MHRRDSEGINNNHKLIFGFVLSVLILLGGVIYVFKALFLNKANTPQLNIFLYTQVLNTSMPIVEISSYDEENMAEERTSIEEELIKLLGIDLNNPISIVSREVSIFKDVKYDLIVQNTSDTQENKNAQNKQDLPNNAETPGINPFVLKPAQVSLNNSSTPVSPDSNKSDTQGSDAGNPNQPSVSTPSNTDTADNSITGIHTSSSKPEVLIYHTHTTESYGSNGNFNEDPSKNICAVGEVLTDELKSSYGISAIHDKTVHIYPSYNDAYSRSRETVNKYLKQYGDFKLIIDLHRDTAYSKTSVTTRLNKEDVTKIRFVLCKKNPHFDKNYSMTSSLQSISNKLFPGFCRDIYYFNYGTKFFNQDLSNNALLIEVGANINNLEESKNSGKYIAKIISEYLHEKK